MPKSMIRVNVKGNFKKIEDELDAARRMNVRNLFDTYGRKIIDALRDATPKDTGVTAESWSYKIVENYGGMGLLILNSNTAVETYTLKRGYRDASRGTRGSKRYYDVPIVIFLHYGHGTRNGGYVPPNSFITDTVDPIFEEMKKELQLRNLIGPRGGGLSKGYGN